MAVTYFLIFAYLLRIIFAISLPPAIDFALVMAACSGWLTLESLFLGYLQWGKSLTVPEISDEGLDHATS